MGGRGSQPLRNKLLMTIKQFNHNDVEVVSKEIVFQGHFRIEKFTLRFRLFAGGWSNNVTREIFERGSAVAVLPYDPINKKVVLIEQFRVGALADKTTPWLLEPVAGIIEPNESIEEVSHREAKEEAGLDIIELIPICNYWVSPGGTTEQVFLFCGKVDATKAGGLHGLKAENEDIRVHVFDLHEARQLLDQGKINNAMGVIALQWLFLNLGKGI